MAILITSSGLVTTGTEGADDIRILSAGITGNGLVINGLAGNDTLLPFLLQKLSSKLKLVLSLALPSISETATIVSTLL